MFRDQLIDKMKRIFLMPRVTYDSPGDTVDGNGLVASEQEKIFINISNVKSTIKDTVEIAKVSGRCTVFANESKLPFGYFAKRIHMSDAADTRDIFFYDFEDNVLKYQNIVERKFSFIYFYHGDYDPNQGQITEIEFEEGT